MIVIADGTPLGKVRKMAAAGARIVNVAEFGTNPEVDSRVFENLRGECEVRRDTALLGQQLPDVSPGDGGSRDLLLLPRG